MIESAVRASLEAAPASGGALIERLRAGGEPSVRGRAALVYGALSNLRARGEIEIVGSGTGEIVWGPSGSGRRPARESGPPPSFALPATEIGLIDRDLGRMTTDLPGHYFEELRRAVTADADRRVAAGARPARAVRAALAELGPAPQVRRFLRRVERGGPVRLQLGAPLRWMVVPLALIALLVLVRLFVLGVYRLPPDSVSMVPALVPAAEGGDALVLADLLAYRWGGPRRGDIVIFRPPGRERETYVKRVLGLPGETISVHKGDLHVNGERLVKERALLDRLKVPVDTPAGPDGPLGEPRSFGAGKARDVVVSVRVLARGAPCRFQLEIEDGDRAPHLVVLSDSVRAAGAYVAGIQAGESLPFVLDEDVAVSLWVTNADGVFRVELDGGEVVRVPLERDGKPARVTLSTRGGPLELAGFGVARDLRYEPLKGAARQVWPVRKGEVFVLGDNSARSRDSRQLGAIPVRELKGRVFAVVWPPRRIRWIR